MVELGTEICQDIAGARQQVVELRSEPATVAAAEGLKIASSGTHPFSHWKDQLITVHERYATIVKEMQQIARANLIFGLHVHVAIPDREKSFRRPFGVSRNPRAANDNGRPATPAWQAQRKA
jgi:glutamate---cysteine ligase / carboxylate-amine ligase